MSPDLTNATASESLSVRVYTPEPAIQHPVVLLRELWRDLKSCRELAWRLFVRDLKAQYRQTYLGYVWALLPPLVGSATFIFLQNQGITNIPSTEIPYAAFAMMGTLLWQTFVDSMQSPVSELTKAKPMLAKINFPREAILLSGLCMVGFNLMIRLGLLVAVMAVWGVVPGASLVLFPFAMLGLVLCGFAIGLSLVPLGGLYGDVARGIPIVAQFWMLLTPVVYPPQTQGLAGWLAKWNPVAPLITSAREMLTGHAITHPIWVICIVTVAGTAAFFGLVVFRIIIPHLVVRMGG